MVSGALAAAPAAPADAGLVADYLPSFLATSAYFAAVFACFFAKAFSFFALAFSSFFNFDAAFYYSFNYFLVNFSFAFSALAGSAFVSLADAGAGSAASVVPIKANVANVKRRVIFMILEFIFLNMC